MTTLNSVPSGLLSTVDATGTLNIQTNSVNALAIDTNQNATMNYVSAQNTFGFKNRIINGAMVIDQRNAGAAVTINTANLYTVDRFKSYAVGSWGSAVFSAQQNKGSVSLPSGFTNYVGLATTTADATLSAGTTYDFGQNIEGLNVGDLGWGTANAKTVTLSFQVYSNLTGTFGGSILNSAENRCYIFSYTISAANTWTTISVTIAGDTSGTWLTTNGVGIKVNFSLGSASNKLTTAGSWGATLYSGVTGQQNVCASTSNYFYITGVQLEKGSIATPFDYRDYGRELAMCQRYCYAFRAQTSSDYIANAVAWSATAGRTIVPLPVPARVEPTGIVVSAGATDFYFNNGGPGGGVCSTFTWGGASVNSLRLLFSGMASMTAGYSGELYTQTSTAYFYTTGSEL